MATSYKMKIVQAGNIIEVYEYENAVLTGYKDTKKNSKGRQVSADDENKEINREKVLSRARKDLRRIVNSNIQKNSKFLTLTFKENVSDIKVANNEFKKFIKRLNYLLGFKVEYSVVPELQKRGAWHYHVILYNTTKKLDFKEIEQCWGNGFIKLNRIDRVDNVGAYICKYMTKCEQEEELRGKKLYFNSRGLKKPLEIKESHIVRIFSDSLQNETPSYENTFSNDYNTVNYKQYILKEQEE